MGRDLAERFPAARAAFDEVDAALGVPISRLCFEGPIDELTRTNNAQPALLAHGAAAWAVTRERLAPRVRAAAGHSLGELTAHYAAGTFGLADAARVVRRRGELMYEAGSARPGAMAALLGDLTQPVEQICARATHNGSMVVPANFNAPAQVVVSGDVSAVDLALTIAKEAGARRTMKLHVSGAFHSPLMQPAADGLAEALGATAMSAPRFPVYANVDATPTTDAAGTRAQLVQQVTSPVRWTRVVAALVERHPGALFVEMGPGSVLRGLVRKIAPGAEVVPCGTAADVTTLMERLA
jgi:[acyl-carrier-protein] S-malonyltransferase